MSPTVWNARPVAGDFVTSTADGDAGAPGAFRWARIRSVDRMAPFLTTLASSSDHWAYLSSLGSLTAGRRNVEHVLFPYRTVDRIHDARGRVGGTTIVRLDDGGLWEPFSERGAGVHDTSQDIERCVIGSAVAYVEHNHSLALRVRQTWTTSERHGLVRLVRMTNTGETARVVEVLDGVLDVMPPSIDKSMMDAYSVLVDAYRSSELADGVGLFGLGSIPVDRAEPSESLSATTAWCSARGTRVLSEAQCGAFRRGESVTEDDLVRGQRGAFLVEQSLTLTPGESAEWTLALEVDQAADDVDRLFAWQLEHEDPTRDVALGVDESRGSLRALIARADGLQCTSSDAEDARHAANTLYNSMRGGLFPHDQVQPRDAFAAHLAEVAPKVWERHADRIARWPDTWSVGDHPDGGPDDGSDPDLTRHLREFLPLAFSRRHGDPSRPWNTFSIDVRGDDGALRFGYQGNWRDIFQNWEALGLAHPGYIESFIVRFLNASTADGYNPYRITSEGLDWEVHDPNDPWSYIGYWGDHQIVYLTRLIERCEEHYPGRLANLFGHEVFVHADVPYRIRGFDDLVRDPQETVDYDDERARVAAERFDDEGADGKLVHDAEGDLVRATLEEKLVVPFLAKLSNLVPGAGIWMNTQRPEWNDANNALVGSGASVVTTCAMFRHARVLGQLFEATTEARLSARTRAFLGEVRAALDGADVDEATHDTTARWATTEALGRAGEHHRAAVYADEGSELETVAVSDVRALVDRALGWLRATVDANRRDDGLYHGYDLVAFDDGAVSIRHLPLMLEGQVAALSAGLVTGADAVQLLDALRASPLYHQKQNSYLLYPDREMPGLLHKGVLPPDAAERVPLLADLLASGDRSIVRQGDDSLRFAPALRSARALSEALDRLEIGPHGAVIARDRDSLLDLYEEVFDHAAFTGRSGTFFGYEGLGCIFWHMVSKLVLSVQETHWRAVDEGEDVDVERALARYYRELRAGLGTHKTPEVFGAFPSEPYSHTPADGVARQPGMSGQVKEDLLSRPGEVGMRVRDGRIVFDPSLVDPAELRDTNGVMHVPGEEPLEIPAGSFAFTRCGIPFVVHAGDAARLAVTRVGGSIDEIDGQALDVETSGSIWSRDGAVRRVDVTLPIG